MKFKQPLEELHKLLPVDLDEDTGGPLVVTSKAKRPDGPAASGKAGASGKAAASGKNSGSNKAAVSGMARTEVNGKANKPFVETIFNRVLMQTSTAGMLDVRAIMSDEAVSSRIKRGDLTDIRIPVDRWPFYLEMQQDTASRGLVNMISTLRNEAESQAIRFISSIRRKKAIEKQIMFALEEEKNAFDDEDNY